MSRKEIKVVPGEFEIILSEINASLTDIRSGGALGGGGRGRARILDGKLLPVGLCRLLLQQVAVVAGGGDTWGPTEIVVAS